MLKMENFPHFCICLNVIKLIQITGLGMKIRKLAVIFTHFVLFSQNSTQIRMKIENVSGEKLEFSNQRSAFVSIGLIGITVVKFLKKNSLL